MNISLHRNIRAAFRNSVTALQRFEWNTPQINAKCAFLFEKKFCILVFWITCIFFGFTLPSEAIDLFACALAWKLDWLYACLRSLHEVTAWMTDWLTECLLSFNACPCVIFRYFHFAFTVFCCLLCVLF